MTDSADRPVPTRVIPGGPDNPGLARGRVAFDQAGPSGLWLGLGLLFSALVAFLWWQVPEIREGNQGIAAFELVGNAADAQAMDRVYVAAALGWDVFFIFAYALVLWWAARFFGRFYRLLVARTTVRVLIAWLAVAAGLLDLLEDGLLAIGVANDYSTDWWVSWVWPVAAVAAWAKFLILAAVVGYVVGGLMVVVAGPWFYRGVPAWKHLTDFAALLWSDPDPKEHQMTTVMDEEPKRKFGIALSGGGIRASSITLGALQVLERNDEPDPLGWGKADVVTAISGGSNMAAGWSISRSARVDAPPNPDAWRSVSAIDPKTAEENHLLRNLGYLLARSPRGDANDKIAPPYPATGETATGDDDPALAVPPSKQPADPVPAPVVDSRPSAYATVFTGFVINASVLLLTLWLVVQLLGRIYGWLGSAPFPCGYLPTPTEQFDCVKGSPLLIRPALITLVLGLVGIVGWVVVAKRFAGNSLVVKAARWTATGMLAAGAILLVGLVLFPYAMWGVGWVTSGGATFGAALAALGSLGAVGRVLMKPAAKLAPVLGGVVFFVLVLFLAAYWAYGAATTPDGFADDPWSLHGLGWWAVGLVTLILVHIGATPEWWSLAGFYRGKLRLAYATYRGPDGKLRTYKNDDAIESESDKPEPDLHSFLTRSPEQPDGTPLTVCATATVSSRSVRTHYNIPAMSTTFSPERVTVFVPLDDEGKFGEWSCATRDLDDVHSRVSTPRLTTMLAVAIASAAVSPAMGRFRVGPTSMLLAFANIRLGVWMPNPRFAAHAPKGMRFPRVRLPYLFKEFIGLHDPSDAYVYLTDGGHWENTGLVELLRKGDFREIVCIDADPGPGDAVKSISEAIDLAVLECGATVSIDLDPMRANPPASRKPEYSDRSVNVGIFVLADRSVGVLWYAKPALVTDMPAALLAFRETHPSFPRVSTLNQFFDTSTFVAYRDLGRFNAHVIRTARSELKQVLKDTPDFAALGGIAYPHWAVAQIASQIRRIESGANGRQDLYEKVCEAILRDGSEPPARG